MPKLKATPVVYKGMTPEDVLSFEINPNWDQLYKPRHVKKNGDFIMSMETYTDEMYYRLYSGNVRSEYPHTVENNIGDVVVGTIISIDRKYITLEAHGKSQIYCLVRDESPIVLKELRIGMDVDFIVESVEYKPAFVVNGNISKIWFAKLANQVLTEVVHTQTPVMATVKNWTPAGYECTFEWSGEKEAFLPNTNAGVNRLINPKELIGQTFEVLVEEWSSDNNNWIISRKSYLETLIEDKLDTIDLDIEYTGIVTGSAKYGVFVEFEGCLTGMIHKANLLPERQEDFRENYTPGTEIKFFIKEIVNRKIILTQVDRESLWDTIKKGNKLSGIVKEVKSFGVLVILDAETMGLIHTSELDKAHTNFKAGDMIQVQVIAISREDRKIFLKPLI